MRRHNTRRPRQVLPNPNTGGRRRGTELWTSAGGVVLRRRGNGALDVALVGRGRPVRWALPKGTRRPDEPIELTAVREVQEETGLRVRVLAPLDRIEYVFQLAGTRYEKTVHFYLMEAVGGNMGDHDGEYQFVSWFPVHQALRRIIYPNESRLVERALAILSAPQTSDDGFNVGSAAFRRPGRDR